MWKRAIKASPKQICKLHVGHTMAHAFRDACALIAAVSNYICVACIMLDMQNTTKKKFFARTHVRLCKHISVSLNY